MRAAIKRAMVGNKHRALEERIRSPKQLNAAYYAPIHICVYTGN